MRLTPEKILASGGEHHVAKYIQGRVIKWPRPERRMPGKTYREIRRDLDLLVDLKVPMPETEILGPVTIDLGGTSIQVPYCIVSEWLSGHHLTPLDFERIEVKRDFKSILLASKALQGSERCVVDLFTGRTLIKAFEPDETLSSNVIVTPEGASLIDPSLRRLQVDSSRNGFGQRLRSHLQHYVGEALLRSH